MPKQSLKDAEVQGRRVLLRVDFNVPLDVRTGAISDDSRIRGSLPSIRYLVEHRAKIIICSHLGRPKGKVDEKLRMEPIAKRLSQLLGLPVSMAPDCVGPQTREKVNQLGEGDILCLENARFHPEEETNDPGFAQELASLADIFVNDAFGTAHRAHASTVGVTNYLPAVAGFLMERELEAMGSLLGNPERPFACVMGGAKVSDKMGLVQNMLKRVDSLLIGGGMAATFLKSQGYEVGRSLVEDDKLELAKELMREAAKREVRLLLPVDVVVADEVEAQAPAEVVAAAKISSKAHIVDIGPQTVELFSSELGKCRTIIWNGPMGIYEMPRFAQGTRALVTTLSNLNATTVIGGGSSTDIVRGMQVSDKMSHVSTGGGATLEFLEGIPLPGVEALVDKV